MTASLTIHGAADAIEFYKQAFGAEEVMRLASPDGKKVMHGELQIGSSKVFISDDFPEWGAKGVQSFGGSPISLMLYVPDVEAAFAKAVAAGATVERPLENQFWGDRTGWLRDPYGYRWSLAQPVEEVPPMEIAKRAAEWAKTGFAG